MKKLLAGFILSAALTSGALAQSVQMPPPGGTIAILCAYNTVAQTLATPGVAWAQCDQNGALVLSSTGGVSGPLQVQGNVADGATDSGNPVKVGGVNLTTLPTYTNNQRATAQYDTRGGQYVVLKLNNSPTAVSSTNSANDGIAGAASNLAVGGFPYSFNGTTWDRNFTCPNAAIINVTATTTQLVALSGATNIRVCGFSVTAAAASTAQFISGTGTNCATGTANLTGAFTLATGTPVTAYASVGSVFRAGASNALCLTAGAGAVTGVLTYVQY